MNYTSNMGMNMPDENDKFSIEHFNTNTQALDIVGKPDEYKNTKTYAVGDLCIHNNILYKCITAVETAEEFNAEKWEVTSLCKEEIANKTAIAELTENFASKIKLSDGGYIGVRQYWDDNIVYIDLMKDSKNGVIVGLSQTGLIYFKVQNGVQTRVWDK